MTVRIKDCPLAAAAEFIGEWSTLVLLHEVFDGITDFEAMRENLRIDPDLLRTRLDALVARGVLERRDDAPNHYAPTPLGRSLRPVLLTLAAWGNRELPPADRGMILVDARTGEEAEPVVVDRHTGRRVDTEEYVFTPGPAASDAMRARFSKSTGSTNGAA
ncbi:MULTISPECIES: winged helix-turn-helix transcriptional regulator [Streptomyces]|uniref:Transcriptional regulator n=1 Tax=Streptomyces alboflavus TaxID=67267 RepID=A0A1Z1WKQ9_9ACTN|nr:helix-turn-helix domain-containing protein [Streptomyces alboflavus]ARX87023.1 transcriptional regulator [Streptomyces alboflavus]